MSIISNIIAGYKGNNNLRKYKSKIGLNQDQVSEYTKCAIDPIYFIENFCWVISLDGGLVPFKLHDYQKRFIMCMHDNRMTVGMMPRQQGKTTCVAGYILWYTLFSKDGKNVAIMANKAAAAREVMSRYQDMYENLPLWMQQGVREWNKGSVWLENNSKVFTAATTRAGIRGKSCNLIYVDEYAIVPNTVAEEFYTAIYPTISSGTSTKFIATSTPLGYNHFWKMYTEAERGINGFVPFRAYWHEHPDRDEAWAAEQRRALGDLKFSQEVGCSFLGSSLTLIDADILFQMVPQQPIYSKDKFDVLERPQQNHTYLMVVDTSKGVDRDYSAFVVVDISQLPYRVVAKFRDAKMSPLLYPNLIYKVAKEYNEAAVLIENNTSEQVGYILAQELEYENILSVNKGKQGQQLGGGFGTTSRLGVTTDKKVKRIGCSNLKDLIEEKKLIVEDQDIISEFSTFVEKKGSYEADEGYNDDLVMCLVLFGWIVTQEYFKDLMNTDLRMLMFENRMKQIEDELTPFGFISDGREDDEEKIVANF